MKRLFDVCFSSLALLLLSPLGLLIALCIIVDSGVPVFYVQQRVGRKNKDFGLYKFRTMRKNSDAKGLLTVGKDSRITKAGHILRKYKLDELPQFLNVLKGEMSIVGPRPEVRKYVDLYTSDQMKVLEVSPGITDLASLMYIDESELLARSAHPEKTYIEEIMPHKLRLNLEYLSKRSFFSDLGIIFSTLKRSIVR
jgi:lipopolysaccharide/colanic/teichoic acid biosynthesis glycosyltransferase